MHVPALPIAARRLGRLSTRPALAIAALLVVLMTASAFLQAGRSAHAHGRLSADEKAYLRLARDLDERHNWADLGLKQPFRWSPGTPMLFAGVAAVTGAPVDRDTALHVQTVVGTLLVPAAFLLALALAGPIAGLVAAAAVAFYAPLIRASSTAGTEPLGALMIVLSALALVLALRRGRPAGFAVAGAVLGAATLVRGDLLPVAVLLPVGTGLAVARRARARAGLRAGAAMLAGVAVLIVPWSAFASAHVHHLVPVTDGGPANLFVGTYLPADGTLFGVKRAFAAQTRRVHPSQRHVPTFKLPEQMVLDAVAARYPRSSRTAALRAAASDNLRRYALGRPVAFAGMEARKLWRMWGSAYAGSQGPPGAVATWEHRLLAALALLGLAGGLVVGRDRRLALLAALIVLTTAVDVAFVSEARHAVRLVPVLVAAGAAGWWTVLRRGRDQPAARTRA